MALADEDYTKRYPRLTTIPSQPLDELSGPELGALFDAYKWAHEAFLGVQNQDRVGEGCASRILDAERDRCTHAMRRIYEIARRRAKDMPKVEVYTEIQIEFSMSCGDWGGVLSACGQMLSGRA